MPVLIVERGPVPGERFQFERNVVLGRGDQCDVQLKDTTVSRRHAEIRRTALGFELVDLGSANGSALNRRRIAEPEPLHDGDHVALGSVIMRYSTSEATLQDIPLKQLQSEAVDEVARTLPAATRRAADRNLQTTLARITMFCELGQFAVHKRNSEHFEEALLNSILHGFPAAVQMDVVAMQPSDAQYHWIAQRRRVGQDALPVPSVDLVMPLLQSSIDGVFALSESERLELSRKLQLPPTELAWVLVPLIFQNRLIGGLMAHVLTEDAPRATDRNALRAAAGITAAVMSARYWGGF